jgi:hypothetical protein
MTNGLSYRTERIDHLGIVSGICQEIGLIETIDQQIGETGRQVSVGQAVQAMVLGPEILHLHFRKSVALRSANICGCFGRPI